MRKGRKDGIEKGSRERIEITHNPLKYVVGVATNDG